MKNRLRIVLGFIPATLCGSLLTVPAQAADTNPGWYAGGEMGLSVGTNQGVYSNGNGVVNDYNTGFAGGFFGGYSFANGWRPEAEFLYHRNGVSNISVTSQNGAFAPTTNLSGAMSMISVMFNGWYDFRAQDGLLATLYPYVGGGLGFAHFSINHEQDGYSGADLVNGTGSAPAIQIGFGANYEILPFLAASLDFRYMMSTDYKISGDVDGNVGKLTGRYRSPSINVGLKYRFGGQV